MSAAKQVDAGPGPVPRAKLRPPELPINHLRRPALVEALLGFGDRGLVSVTAPAGYGKTTLLAEWADVTQRPVAWVTLDNADNDPINAMAAIATAFGAAQGFGGGFSDWISAPGGSVLGRLVPQLAEVMDSAGQPFALVLDDLHELSGPGGRDVVDLLASHVSRNSTVVLAGRTESQMLPAWRVDGPVLELGADDLAFDVDESIRFLELGGAALGDEIAERLHDDLEGWAAGLQLALVVARRESFEGFGASDRFVADYLRRETLDGLPVDHHRFLTRTAVLDELTGPSCDALLGTDDSSARLQELERANLFLVPLDRRRSRYRYHAAFRDLLLAELERSEGADASRRLHRRASAWYDRQGAQDQAVGHALLSEDVEWTAPLVAKVAQGVVARGRVSTLRRWCDQLGDEVILDHPPLAVVAGWAAGLSGDPTRAARWLERLDGLSFDGTPSDGSTSFASARAMFRAFSCPDGPEAMLSDAELALAIEPSWAPWRATAEVLAAEARLLRGQSGDAEAAWSLFGDAIRSAESWGIATSMVACLSERALLAEDRNNWELAYEAVTRAWSLIEQRHMQDYMTSLLTYAAAARLALRAGDVAAAERWLTLAMRGRVVATEAAPYWAVRLRVVLARVHVGLGEPVAARHLLREADDILRRRPLLGSLVDEVEQVRELVASAPNLGGSAPLSPAELRVLPFLQTHLTFEEIADRLFLSRNTVGSHARAIYRKLDVSSRGAAVAAASNLGLLGDVDLTLSLDLRDSARLEQVFDVDSEP